MYSSAAIANRFLRIADREDVPLDPMKIQKLVYIAHGWHLGYTGDPLCSEIVQAWRWGPVFPDLYFAVKHWARHPITEPVGSYWEDDGETPDVVADDESFESSLIKGVWRMYRGSSGMELSALTHAPDSPWWKIVQEQKKRWYSEIPDELIQKHYEEKLRVAKATA